MASNNYDSIIYDGTSLKKAREVPDYAGEVSILKFTLFSPNNFPTTAIDIRNMMTRCEITQNIFSPYISGYVDIGDAIGLFERIPIIGEELFHISFQ